jgi:WD40 repeat protein
MASASAQAPVVAGTAPARPDVFISYSRRDKAFVEGVLFPALVQRDKDVWIDLEDIPPASDWRQRVLAGVAAANAFVFILSPESLTSSVCAEELARAVELNKRIIPVLRRDPGDARVPPELARSNWVYLRDEDDHGHGIALVVQALETDLEWRDAHSRLTVRTAEWLDGGRDRAFLLRGSDLSAAEAWLARQDEHAERATPEQAAYIIASRQATTRRQRLTLVAVAGALAVAIVLAAVAVRGRTEAREQRDRAQAQARLATSRGLAVASTGVLRGSDPGLGLLLAAQAMRFDPTPEARGSLFAALNAVPRVHKIIPLPGAKLSTMSVDGRAVAYVTTDGRLQVHPLVPGSVARRHRVRGQIVGVGVGHGGAISAVGDANGSVSIYDASSGGRTAHFPGPAGGVGEEGPFEGTSFAIAEGRRFVAWNGANVSVWNGRVRRLLPLPGGALPGSLRLSFSHDGRTLTAASDSLGTVVVWRLDADARPMAPPKVFRAGSGRGFLNFGDGIASVTVSPNGRMIATGGFDGTVVVWDAATGHRLTDGPRGSGAVSVAFSADGRRLIATAKDRFRIWDVAGHRVVASFERYRWGDETAFLPDSQTLATVLKDGVALWSPQAPPFQLARRFAGPTTDISRVVYSPAGDLLATLSYTAIRLWNPSTLRPVGPPLDPGPSVDLAFDRDGKTLAAWSTAEIRLWDVDTRHPLGTLRLAADAVAAAPTGFVAVATNHAGLAVWDLRQRHQLRTLRASKKTGGPIEMSPDGRAVVASIRNGTALRLWSARSGRVTRPSLPGASLEGVRFSADGRVLVTAGDDGTARVWDSASGRQLGAPIQVGMAWAIALDQNGRMATLSQDSLQLWDIRTRQPLASQRVATAHPTAGDQYLAFSPSGRTLAVVDLATQPLIFNTDERSWSAAACRIANRNLTAREWQRYVGPGFSRARTCT